MKFLKNLKLWQKIILSIFLLGILYFIIIPLAFCTNIDLEFDKKQEYISCSSDTDCIPKSCGCLNSKGSKRFSLLMAICGMRLGCLPPSECKCQEGKCSGSFDDYIAGQPCVEQSDCPEGFMCYKVESGYKILSCDEVVCECFKYCNSDDDCPRSKPTCSPIQIMDYMGICVD